MESAIQGKNYSANLVVGAVLWLNAQMVVSKTFSPTPQCDLARAPQNPSTSTSSEKLLAFA